MKQYLLLLQILRIVIIKTEELVPESWGEKRMALEELFHRKPPVLV